MGVHGLWELLSPVGRRVSVETLAGKRLAIDASIWMIQFMKAMRDEKGEMVRNAHVLGFFRRICKLLYLRTKPIFVFDGGTPALKRRTVIARRRQRENAQAKVRKTAEKLLLNHLKAMKLKQLAEEMKTERKASDGKGKKIVDDEIDNVGNDLVKSHVLAGSCDQEKLDEMLAASLAAEEDGRFPGNASTSAAGAISEEDDDDEDEEMILPTMQGNVDPAVLAALPPSMQLDLLVQMRERLMAENRQKYQKVKKAPEKFSELQIQSYLKTVAFRREIDGVQKSAAARGVGGVQTSRIASEANREFIFSSSFTGDKEVLMSTGAGRDDNKQYEILSEHPQDKHAPAARSNISTGLGTDKSGGVVHENVETYLDERGRVRVSRVRAMGIRMTRDLERNLNMMREIDQGNINQNQNDFTVANNVSAESNFPNINPFLRMSNEMNDVINGSCNRDKLTVSGGETSLEISFEDGLGKNSPEDDDDIFARLVVGDLVIKSPVDNNSGRICPADSASDSDWEEGIVGGKTDDAFLSDIQVETKPSSAKAYADDDSEVELEHGVSDDHGKSVSRSALEEEADFHEAIRRSLKDSSVQEVTNVSSENVELELLKDKPCDSYLHTQSDVPRNEGVEMLDPVQVAQTVTEEVCLNAEKLFNNSKQIAKVSCSASSCRAENASGCGHVNVPGVVVVDPQGDSLKSASTSLSDKRTLSAELQGPSPVKESTHLEQKLDKEVNREDISLETETGIADFGHGDIKVVQDEGTEASLAEEISALGQERVNLGYEQRKLERNAESVSSEMFAECQELLQMFGLPYIIAPMEAEAQCAYMEVTGFVDGVVTDDSDVFLFGARSVYKNIFDDRKYVETYLMKDIENELGLSREKLIRMALLLGSDYTEGVSGIGIVNAIEVVNAFPDEDGLYKFREWIESPDPTILGRFEEPILSSKRRNSKVSDNDESYCGTGKESYVSGQNVSSGCEQNSTDQKIFMEKHRKVSKNWHIPSSFPSEAVISAYLMPQVDRSTEPFSWGKPDILVLHKLCWEKFAWTNQKADELLLPVLKEYNKHETQLRLESFYTFNERFAKIRSKRIKKAVKGIAGKQSVQEMDDDVQEVSERPIELGENNSEDITGINDRVDGVKELSKEKLSHKNSGKRKAHEMATSSAQELRGAVGKRSTNRVRSENVRGRGRGRGRKIRSRSRKTGSESVAASSIEGALSDNEQEADAEIETEVRRSFRTRRTVNYTEDDFDLDDTDKSVVASDQDCAYAVPQEMEAKPSSSSIISEYGTDGFTDKNESNSADLLALDDLCKGYLETEGQYGLNQNGNSSVKGHLPDDYLKMGGGFCAEDGDKELNECASNLSSDIFNEHRELSDISALRGSGIENDQVLSLHSLKRTALEPQNGGSVGGHDFGSLVNRQPTSVDASETRTENLKDDNGPNSAGKKKM